MTKKTTLKEHSWQIISVGNISQNFRDNLTRIQKHPQDH